MDADGGRSSWCVASARRLSATLPTDGSRLKVGAAVGALSRPPRLVGLGVRPPARSVARIAGGGQLCGALPGDDRGVRSDSAPWPSRSRCSIDRRMSRRSVSVADGRERRAGARVLARSSPPHKGGGAKYSAVWLSFSDGSARAGRLCASVSGRGPATHVVR